MKCWSVTDKGKIRQQNEDTYLTYIDHEHDSAACIVCDGMGGAKAGGIASRTTAEMFMGKLRPYLNTGRSLDELAIEIRSAVQMANSRVFSDASHNEDHSGMGTTIVGVVVSGENTAVLNVGDSRAYHITTDGIFRITRDHSVVEDMIDRGDLTREQARSHPNKNLITRAVGTDSAVLCDIYNVDLKPKEFILLCTDGLTNVINEQEILYEVLHGENIDTCCLRMLEIVISRGAPDNVTIVLFQR